MKWQTKAAAIGLIESLPMSDTLYYNLQRRVTKSLPRKFSQKYLDYLDWHIKNIETHLGSCANAKVFEFGAGWDLFYNVWLYCHGVDSQILVDLKPNAKIDLINHEISRCQALTEIDVPRRPQRTITSLADLRSIGVTYIAPRDARDTKLDDGSVNVVLSTNTMEHVPFDQLEPILVEARRILAPGGIVSSRVDYADHYSYVDRSIGPYNYMRFSDEEWKRFNPSNHFQNRRRHCEYVALFKKAGFEIVADERLIEYPDARVPDASELADRFKGFSNEDLRTTGGLFCARKSS
ncbi:MAG: class I SAM-dependent methyltransferase [Hyphomicrobiaceae bacterium]|nr:class I SAM-dependent methyltransferase [Hyphomicrobiaceae bacterium]